MERFVTCVQPPDPLSQSALRQGIITVTTIKASHITVPSWHRAGGAKHHGCGTHNGTYQTWKGVFAEYPLHAASPGHHMSLPGWWVGHPPPLIQIS